ncbi:uncharacterized protein LOC135217107 isoform X2 [Macrobrachium nipponense]
MSSNCQSGSAMSSSGNCQLPQDSDEDDVDHGELWNHRPLQHQVGYLSLGGGFSGSLSPQPSSSAECERRVSPLDPNLSSAARYSPPPPYNNPIDEIGASIDHQSSPLDHISHASSLATLPVGVTSSISSASGSLVITEAHRHSGSAGCSSVSTSRANNMAGPNSLFSSPASIVSVQPKWEPPRVTVRESEHTQVHVPAESIWAKQKRLALSGNSLISITQPSTQNHDRLSFHESRSPHLLSQPSQSVLSDEVPGPSGLRVLSHHNSANLQRSPQQNHEEGPKLITQPSSCNVQISPKAGPSGLQCLNTHFEPRNVKNDLQVGGSVVHSHSQGSSLPSLTLPLQLLSKLKDMPHSPISKENDNSSEDDSSDIRLHLSPTPGPSGVVNPLVNLHDSDAEALDGMVSGCEASSSNVRGHMSPLRSPSTPTDNCIVSSSTGHIDSIPPTPVEFQGNDVSGPSSPVSPSLDCAVILDSTVDSTSGRGILDSQIPASDDESDEDLTASAQLPLPVMTDEQGEISTSEVGLQNSDDSEDVELLVSPQGMFSSGRASTKHFMEQISLSLSQFQTSSLDANLSSVGGEKCEQSVHSPPNGEYLSDPLAIPGPSGVSLPGPSRISNSRQAVPSSRSLGLGQPSGSSRQHLNASVEVLGNNLPLLDIGVGLAGCSTSEGTDQLVDEDEPEACEPLVTGSSSVCSDNLAVRSENQTIDPLSHHSSYVLELNDESSLSSDALSATSLVKDENSERNMNHGGFSSVEDHGHHLLNGEQLVSGSLGSSLNLNLASSDVEVSVALQGPSQQHAITQHLQPDQVSLLVGGGDETSDGALLMMVSTNGDSLPGTLTLGKPSDGDEADHHISQLTDSDQILQTDGMDQNLQSLPFEKSHSEGQLKEKGETDKSVEAYVEANFWCGECEQMDSMECPHHHIQGMSDRTIKTRGWNSLSSHQLVTDKSCDIEDCISCDPKSSQDCMHYRIQTICDKPVKTRAWASLPAQHLVIRKVPFTEEHGVFVRKAIPKRTRFGPLEGMLVESSNEEDFHLGAFTLQKDESLLLVDTSDEDCSNWMRFVRRATTYLEQNCAVVQIEEALYFLTTTDIPPRAELKVGYSKQYAEKRNLTTLEPTQEEIDVLDEMRKSWPCFECDEGFETSAELQQHLVCHDDTINEEDKKKRKKVKGRRPRGNADHDGKLSKKIKVETEEIPLAGTSEDPKESDRAVNTDRFQRSQCLKCNMIFSMPELLNIHQLKHNSDSHPESTAQNSMPSSQSDPEDDDDDDDKGEKAEDASPRNTQERLSDKEEIASGLLPFNKTCPFCKKVCDTDESLLSHVDEHGAFHPGSLKPYKCDYCYKSFTRRFRLEAHKSVHGNEAEKPFRCNLCLRRFCSNSALTAHIRFHIEGCKGYDCPICREGFFSVAGLKAHVSSHCINGEYNCPKCNKVFPTYSKIRRHIRSYHAVMPHICSICGKEMPSVDKLKIHMLSHSDRRDFLCPDCGKSFKRKDKMREHSKRMHSAERGDRSPKSVKGPPKFVPKVDPTDYKQFLYKCTICLLGFKRRGMLVNHLAKRHPNVDLKCVPELNQPILKANRCYKCQHCDKRYRSSSKRKLHILKYHPGAELPPRAKPTSDNDTESSSYTSSSPHPCKWCYRQYASRARLLRHQRHHHPSHFNNEGDNETSNINNVAFLDTSAGISGELSLNGQIVADASILRNHRLVNISRETSSSAEAEGTEEDLLTQAMGEITPLAARQVLVSSDGTQQGPTLALVGADVPDTVTLSLPNGQLISLIHGIAVPGGPSTVTSTSRTAGSSDGNVNVAEGVLQREEGSSMRMAYTLGTALNESNNEADAVEQVVLAAQQPSSPSNHVVWQHALAFNSTSS